MFDKIRYIKHQASYMVIKLFSFWEACIRYEAKG